MNKVVRLVNSVAQRTLSSMFPGYFQAAKHDHYKDFGYPVDLGFSQLYAMYTRNGIGHAAVDKTILKTWQENPFLLDHERDGSEGSNKVETTLEKEVRQRFDDLRLWARLADADRMSLVGGYSGVILRLADSRQWQQPVETVPGGLDGLVSVIPAWAGQLTVSEWDMDQNSDHYGEPKMFQFNESNVDTGKAQHRQMLVHSDRVLVWSEDGTVHGRSALEPGYNDLMTLEKISGAGGEGFWKNAKSAPVLELDKDTQLKLPPGMTAEQFADSMTEQVESWQQGFDKMLMLQGIQAKTLGITLPSPEHFFGIALQSFAASIGIPVKILVGSQTGERASTEDANEWSTTNMSRRANEVVPNIMALVNRLERFGVLPKMDWFLDWTDLTESSMSEKIDRAVKMADTNQKMKDSGEIVFTHEEIRSVVDLEPLSDAEKYRDEPDDDEGRAALGDPATTGDPAAQ